MKEEDLSLLVGNTKNERGDNKCFATCFYKLMDKPLEYFTKQDEEVEELKWVSLEEFEEMVKSGNEKLCIFKNNEYYQKILNALKRLNKEIHENS